MNESHLPRWTLPLAIALVGLVLNIIVATSMAETTDEAGHVRYGSAILQGSADKSDPSFDSKMPVSVLNVLHRIPSRLLRSRGLAPGLTEALRDFRAFRYATVAASFGLCLLVYFYAQSLYGRVAGLFAQLLFVLSPNIIASSALATTDLYIALSAVLFLYTLRRFLLEPSARNAALAASTLALAQLTKFVAAYLYLVLLLVLVPAVLYSKYKIPARRIVLLLGLNAACYLGFVNAGFLFDRTFTPLARYQFHSATFQALQQVPVLREIPLPVPYPYIQGFDWMSYHNARGLSFGNIVLLDKVRGPQLARTGGFAYYYLVAYALKEPLGMQILLLLSLSWLVRHRHGFLINEWPLVATAGVLLTMLSFFSNTQIGIRHILPVLVIFIILSGAAFGGWAGSSRPRMVLLAGCLIYTAVSVASYFPHMIPYFNEIVTDRKLAYHFLADSNLDWGQDKWVVEAYLESHPGIRLNPPQPVAGRVLVRGNLLAGVAPPKADYWVREWKLKPEAQIGYGHFLFTAPSGPP